LLSDNYRQEEVIAGSTPQVSQEDVIHFVGISGNQVRGSGEKHHETPMGRDGW
jgi:hypothetical protein